MTTKREEHAKFTDAIINGRDRAQDIRAEWEALGLEPRVQSPSEMTRVLKTWKKDVLIRFLIRAESDEIKAKREKLGAWKEAQEVREGALILPADGKRFEFGAADPFNAWLMQHHGQSPLARDVFMAGWRACARAREATADE